MQEVTKGAVMRLTFLVVDMAAGANVPLCQKMQDVNHSISNIHSGGDEGGRDAVNFFLIVDTAAGSNVTLCQQNSTLWKKM